MPITEITIPAEAPVMVLPNALLFPNAMMPLYIFEPRYRQMLEWALEHDRVFCIALRKQELPESPDARHFHHTVGLGLIRACVGREDGTSHLMLQGLARVRFMGFSKTEPFFVARLKALPSLPLKELEDTEARLLADEVREICGRFRASGITVPEGVDEFLARVEDPDLLADSIAHTFLRDPLRRQELLETTDICDRLARLGVHLRAELGE